MKRLWVLAGVALTAATPVAQTMIDEHRGMPLFTMRHPLGWTIFAERGFNRTTIPADAAAGSRL